MNILFTGATGLFGSYLVKKFISAGTIYALKRENSSTRLLGELASQINWKIGDVSDYQSLEDALEGMDLVVHCAGMVSFNPKDEEVLNKVNHEGTANLVNAMLEKGVKKIIHVSSVAALGRNPESLISDEKTLWAESPYNTPYAISKYLGELEAWRGVQEGLKAIVVLPSVILGKVSDDRSSTQIYQYVLEGNSYYPQGTVNFIDARDAANLTFMLFEKGLWNDKFILNHSAIPYKDFFGAVAKAFGKKAPTKKLKQYQLDMALFFVGIAKALGLSKSPLNRQTAMLSQMSITMDNSKIKKLFDYKFYDLEDTLDWAWKNEKSEPDVK